MNNKDHILENIRKHSLIKKPLPNIPEFATQPADLLSKFTHNLKSNHAEVVVCDKQTYGEKIIDEEIKRSDSYISLVPFSGVSPEHNLPADDLEAMSKVELFIVHGGICVAENGAIWIEPDPAYPRILPFIVQHLFIVVNINNLVANMHEAYKLINRKSGFSVFIAGPSKTADIEQILVIGAHGPKKMTVLINSEK